MQLPALAPEERACLRALQPGAPVHVFARRLQQRLLAALGVRVSVRGALCDEVRTTPGEEPVIVVDAELASAWLDLRMGGKAPGARLPMKDAALADPFRAVIRRTLAESVVNAGKAEWPQATRLCLDLGGQTGNTDIFWNSAHAMDWARRILRERA